MIGLRFIDHPRQCPYLPDRIKRLENEFVVELSAEEYVEKMNQGFRRFGHILFRPSCPSCTSCLALRIDVEQFRPNRSQRRCWKLNCDDIRREIVAPSAAPEVLELSDHFHNARSHEKGWEPHQESDASSHRFSFVDNPFPVSEWRYYLDDQLVGVGYVDDLPTGLSAVYFLHEPDLRERSLGTYNVLSLIDEAISRGLRYIYLGYYVEGCESLEYKDRFQPNEVLDEDGNWRMFRSRVGKNME